MEGEGDLGPRRAWGLCRWTTPRPRCRPAAGVPVSPTEAMMDHLEMRSLRGASQSWRQRPQGQQGSSCFCCPVAVRGGGAAKERPPLLTHFPPAPAPPRAARPPLFRDTRVTGSPSCPGCGGGGSSSGGRGREGCQGLLVAAPLRATALPRCRRRYLQRLGLLLAPFRDFITSDGGTTKGGHGRAKLREERIEAEGEMGVRPQPRVLLAFKEEQNRRLGNRPRIVCTYEKATTAIATADCGRN
jgi:hypothetical protein